MEVEVVADRARISGVEAGVAAGLVPAAESEPDSVTLSGTDAGVEPAEEPEEAPVAPATGEVSALHELPDWTDPPTMQVPQVLLDLEDGSAADGDRLERPAQGGPVWKEHLDDWNVGDSVLADLAGSGLGVAASEVSSADDPFAYDFLDLGDDASGAVRLPSPPTQPTSPAPVSESARDLGAPPAEERGPGTELGGSAFADDDVAPDGFSPARRPRRRAAHRARPERAHSERPTLAARIAAGPDTASKARGGRNPVVATMTGIAIAAVTLFCFAAGPPAVVALVAVIGTLAVAELFGALRHAGYRPATLIGLVATPVIVVAAYLRGPVAIPVVFAAVVMLTMLWYLLGVTRREPVVNIAVTVLAFGWVGVLGSFSGLLVDPHMFPGRHGVALLLGAIIAAVGYDIGGYAIGSWLGRHKLAPAVSPNKTWEGLFGGSAVALVASVAIVSQIHPWDVMSALGLGIVVALMAPIGDLAESLVKRDLGVKDMGSILPGHGGVLDRIDALLFVLPVAYYVVRLAHIG